MRKRKVLQENVTVLKEGGVAGRSIGNSGFIRAEFEIYSAPCPEPSPKVRRGKSMDAQGKIRGLYLRGETSWHVDQ